MITLTASSCVVPESLRTLVTVIAFCSWHTRALTRNAVTLCVHWSETTVTIPTSSTAIKSIRVRLKKILEGLVHHWKFRCTYNDFSETSGLRFIHWPCICHSSDLPHLADIGRIPSHGHMTQNHTGHMYRLKPPKKIMLKHVRKIPLSLPVLQ